jgi:predicted Zn-ribbon and HTH transcriptional regulator
MRGGVVNERCPNCGYEFSTTILLKASKSRYLLCPRCRKAFFKLSDVSVLDGVGLISTRLDLRGRSKKYLEYACERLNLSKETEKTAWSVLERFNRDWGTRGTVAAALYIACLLSGEHRSQSEIASALKVTEVTVRKRYGEISKCLDIDRRKMRRLKKFVKISCSSCGFMFYAPITPNPLHCPKCQQLVEGSSAGWQMGLPEITPPPQFPEPSRLKRLPLSL